jgi:hypothetical protein
MRPDRVDYLLTIVAWLDAEAEKMNPVVGGTREAWSALDCMQTAARYVHSAAGWLARGLDD